MSELSLSEVRRLRLYNQHIAATTDSTPADVVRWLVAMQAQEFRHAKWAIGLRLQNKTDPVVEKAFNDGAILRTHAMRPTWHFVSPADIRWLLELTSPRVHLANGPYYKKMEIPTALLVRCHNIIARALEGKNYLQRKELQETLKRNKIKAEGPRLAYIMMYAELERLICSGPRIGKQFSYALLDERAPQPVVFDRDKALSSFIERYFQSRGPATLNDFTYWSGLTLKDAMAGIEAVKRKLYRIMIDGKEYYSGNLTLPKPGRLQDTFLMPDYDEYGMSYKDRSALRPSITNDHSKEKNLSIFGHYVIVEGTMQGSWSDELTKDKIKISTRFVKQLDPRAKRKVDKALVRYSSFFGKKLQSAAQLGPL